MRSDLKSDNYISKDRGHPAYRPSMFAAQVLLDGKQVLDWQIANSVDGYVVTNNPEKHTIYHGDVQILKPTNVGMERQYVEH